MPVPYSADPRDAWNRIFRALFTRDVTLRLTQDFPQGAPFARRATNGYPHERLVSTRAFVRRESGDRPIAPLYPSFMSVTGITELLSEPRCTEFKQALQEALAATAARPPLQRALMQADLWAAYELLFGRRGAAGVPVRGFDAQRAEFVSLLARLIHKLALTPAEIRALPDNYGATANIGMPPLFQPGSGWIEVEWRPTRSHDFDAGLRTASRVFFRPRTPPADINAFVNRFRNLPGERSDPAAMLEAMALVTEQLLIASDGAVTRSPLTIDVQIRRVVNDARGRFQRIAVEEFELSRQRLRDEPAAGGFVHEAEDFPAYLSAAGNDYRFASPAFTRNGSDLPVLGTLNYRCVSCHGDDFGGIFTFSQIFPGQLPPAKALPAAEDVHADFVAHEKMNRPEFQALLAGW